MTRRASKNLAATAGGIMLLTGAAYAQRTAIIQTENRIENQVAVFAALDKVTARISKLEVPLGETVKFGALTVTPKSCYTRSPLETPKTSTFVEVTETQLDGQQKKIFGGWMFAESPGLNAVEHPVYDVWLTECAKPKTASAAAPAAKGAPAPPPKAATPPQPTARSGPAPVPQPGAPSPAWNPQTPQAQPQPAPQPLPNPGAAGDDLTRRRPPR